jgi:hypothetical protein
MPCCNFDLKLLDSLILKLDDGIASGTDQMIMMFTCHNMLEACLAVMQKNFTSQAGLYKQLQGAVHRSLPDTRVAALDLQVQLFDADMLVGGEENIKDNIALTGGTQSLAGCKFVEGFFLFQDHRPSLLNLIFNIKRPNRYVNPFSGTGSTK